MSWFIFGRSVDLEPAAERCSKKSFSYESWQMNLQSKSLKSTYGENHIQ